MGSFLVQSCESNNKCGPSKHCSFYLSRERGIWRLGKFSAIYSGFIFVVQLRRLEKIFYCGDFSFLVLLITFYEFLKLSFSFILDYVQQKRFQNDLSVNNTLIDVLQGQRWETVPWKKLQVGDIVRVSYCHYI